MFLSVCVLQDVMIACIYALNKTNSENKKFILKFYFSEFIHKLGV